VTFSKIFLAGAQSNTKCGLEQLLQANCAFDEQATLCSAPKPRDFNRLSTKVEKG
jgi:hypothetical protein